MQRVAVIGAGVTGLVCARALAREGVDVTVFDKGRSVGGRLATRRVSGMSFDLGAQYFTARDPRFQAELAALRDASTCAPWEARVVAVDRVGAAPRPTPPTARFVGVPDMSALGRSLAQDVSVQTGVRVDRIERVGEALSLRGARAPSGVTLPASPQAPPGAAVVELGSFDAVLISAPAPQAAALVAQLDPDLGARARAVAFEPCFALGFAVSRAPGEEQQRAALEQLPFDGAFIGRPHAASDAPSDSPLAWVARDGSKPGRASRASSGADHERWVLHASGAWSRSFFDASEAEVTRAMLDAFAALFGLPTLEPALSVLRRWTLARATTPLAGALFDADRRVGLGGDWALGGRVEGAYLSGLALAEGLRRT